MTVHRTSFMTNESNRMENRHWNECARIFMNSPNAVNDDGIRITNHAGNGKVCSIQIARSPIS